MKRLPAFQKNESLIPKTRLVGVGLLIHMALDGLDCVM
jgi:hypothetical protein